MSTPKGGTIWCGKLKPADLDGKAPAGYRHVLPGSEKKPGRYGEGIGGEAVVCLLPGDDGQWFRDLCKKADPKGEWDIRHYPASSEKAA